MSLLRKSCRFVKRCGAPARFVATLMVGCVAPRSVTELIGKIIDRSLERVTVDVQALATPADLAGLERIFDLFLGDLDFAVALLLSLEAEPERARTLFEDLAADARCGRAVRELAELTWDLSAMQAFQTELADEQDAMFDLGRRALAMPIDFLDEEKLTDRPRLPDALGQITTAVGKLVDGQPVEAERLFLELCRLHPRSGVLALGLGAALFAGGKHAAAGQSLARAHRLRPEDATLEQLSNVATRLSGPVEIAASPDARSRFRPHTGALFDGWLLERKLGRGGWGRVYRARKADKVRALKILHPEFTDKPNAAKRFQREVAILAGLEEHPHLVRIDPEHLFRRCPESDCFYYAMELVDGPSLHSYLEQMGPLSFRAVFRHFAGVAEALAVAHRRGVVHRDIKPGNILVRSQAAPGQGRLVLADFGLAGAVRTHKRSASWTALFAAPEQFRTGVTDFRSDVFSLAATIYYCLMYADPIAKTRFKAKLLGKHLPAPLRAFLDRCLDNDPDERPADADAFLHSWRDMTPFATLSARGE